MGRIRHLGSLVRAELRTLLAERAAGGVEYAVRRRIAHHAGVPALRRSVDADVQALTERLDAEQRRHAEAAEAVAGLLARIEAGERDRAAVIAQLGDLVRVTTGLSRCVEDLSNRLAALEPQVTSVWQALDGHRLRLEELERAQAVRAFTGWIEQAELAAAPLISVIMPTYNRAALLPRAVASVRGQAYPHWELVVADDASTDATPEVIAAIASDDPRVRALRVPHGGCCAARNAALDVAKGEVVAYLDDDNTMHPLWLKSLAWAFTAHPEVDVLYGAFVIDDVHRVNRLSRGAFPRLTLHPYKRAHLEQGNLADMGAIAHRAGLPEARFDEGLVEMGDWDLLCKLTRGRDPLVLPSVACFYSTDAPNRLSGGPTYDGDYAAVRARHEPQEVRS